jgi:hypothetical protein
VVVSDDEKAPLGAEAVEGVGAEGGAGARVGGGGEGGEEGEDGEEESEERDGRKSSPPAAGVQKGPFTAVHCIISCVSYTIVEYRTNWYSIREELNCGRIEGK